MKGQSNDGLVVMKIKKIEKVDIIKWYISQHCSLGNIQTLKDTTNDLDDLETMVMNDRAFPQHINKCSTCWYETRDYLERCKGCCHSDEKLSYVFPYIPKI